MFCLGSHINQVWICLTVGEDRGNGKQDTAGKRGDLGVMFSVTWVLKTEASRQ